MLINTRTQAQKWAQCWAILTLTAWQPQILYPNTPRQEANCGDERHTTKSMSNHCHDPQTARASLAGCCHSACLQPASILSHNQLSPRLMKNVNVAPFIHRRWSKFLSGHTDLVQQSRMKWTQMWTSVIIRQRWKANPWELVDSLLSPVHARYLWNRNTGSLGCDAHNQPSEQMVSGIASRCDPRVCA